MAKWENIRFDTKTFQKVQSKRGAEVDVPLEDRVIDILDQQYQEYGNQPYVAPHYRTLQLGRASCRERG